MSLPTPVLNYIVSQHFEVEILKRQHNHKPRDQIDGIILGSKSCQAGFLATDERKEPQTNDGCLERGKSRRAGSYPNGIPVAWLISKLYYTALCIAFHKHAMPLWKVRSRVC